MKILKLLVMRIINIMKLEKKYGKNVIFNEADFVIESGKSYLLIGENGSGKSTLFKCILGLSSINGGEIKKENIKIGYVPEKMIMPSEMTIYDFLLCLGELKGVEKEWLDKKIDYELSKWGLIEKQNNKIKTLSKGMVQKVLIIQAFLDEPDFLIFDEVLNGLDRYMQKLLLETIENYKANGKSILIATHYPKEYLEVIDEIFEIKNKKVYKVEKIN